MNQELIDLQTKVAFQEEALSQFNDILTSQQRQIDQLRLELSMLRDSYQELLDGLERPPVNEKPPHY